MNNEERNAFVERRYDELRMEGKHGHYECLFRVVHEIVDAELARVREDLAEQKEIVAEMVRATGRVARHLEQRTERAVRRAYIKGWIDSTTTGSFTNTIDAAVAQAMREGGE